MINEMIRLENLPPRMRQNRLDLSMGNVRVCEEKLGGQVCRPAPLKMEFRKMLIPMPLLFLSGIFTGIGIMLALN